MEYNIHVDIDTHINVTSTSYIHTCNPMVTCVVRILSAPIYFVLDCNNLALCSIISTCLYLGNNRYLVTLPIPAPQSATISWRKLGLFRCIRSRKVLESRTSMSVTRPKPPNTPSSIGRV